MLIALVAIGLIRRPELSRTSLALIALGSLLLALAAGQPIVNLPHRGDIVVMVDFTPSTRTASYRDAQSLQQRLDRLLQSKSYRRIDFGDESSDHTTFEPPHGADAIVLFSDCRFDLPDSAPPTYVVVDPNLEHPADASVQRLESASEVIATVRNSGPPRELLLNHAPTTVPTGTQVITTRPDPSTRSITARFTPGDAWRENDSLALDLPPPPRLERWWVSTKPSPRADSWRTISPGELPQEPAEYLAASVIVLDNVPADAISPPQQDRLIQFVRDLGGGVLILSGDHAFSAGGYDGSGIDSLSPLASSPPRPQRQWIILVDSSGSMASPAPDSTSSRWQIAANSATQLLSRLPPNDVVSIGSFARDLRWWSQSKSASDTAKLPFPPAKMSPGGPTNLEPVLRSLASQIDGSMPTNIIVISDADTAITDPAGIAFALAQKHVKVNLLATADVARSPLPRIVSITQGQLATQLDPRFWSDAATQLARSVAIQPVQHEAIRLDSKESLLNSRVVTTWNRTWPKRDATLIASARLNEEAIPLAARWQLGSGQVIAAAFETNADEAEALAKTIARPPRDPRFSVSWKAGSKLDVTVDAIEPGRYLNDLNMTLQLTERAGRAVGSFDFTQSGPGRYEASIPSPRTSVLATIRQDDQVVDRFAVAGRYPAEFDAIENDHATMQALATRTGGAVVDPSDSRPINFNWQQRRVALTSLLACCGASSIAVALLIWKLK